MLRRKTVDVLVDGKLTVHSRGVRVHLERDVSLLSAQVSAKADGGCCAVAEFANDVVSTLEDVTDLDWIIMVCFVVS